MRGGEAKKLFVDCRFGLISVVDSTIILLEFLYECIYITFMKANAKYNQ